MSEKQMPEKESKDSSLEAVRVVLIGRFAAMTQRDAKARLRGRGAVVVDRPGPTVDWIVLGEEGIPLLSEVAGEAAIEETFSPEIQEAIAAGRTSVFSEAELWKKLGLTEFLPDEDHFYTPAMLARLLEVPLSVIRQWHRHGLIVPVREVRHLAYFDYQEVATARRLSQLLSAGVSPAAIEKKLETFSRYLPGVERPLAQLAVMVQGGDILLRKGDRLVEPGGQLRFDFDAAEPSELDDRTPFVSEPSEAAPPEASESFDSPPTENGAPFAEMNEEPVLSIEAYRDTFATAQSADQLVELAIHLEEAGHLSGAAEAYRAAMAATGPTAELCFRTAELLYQLGDLPAARERFYMAIELDEDYVEARANLGCVLAETGELDLAIAAFRGALAYHADYADAHYHLAQTLETAGQADESRPHWEAFLHLSPNNPWADEARERLES